MERQRKIARRASASPGGSPSSQQADLQQLRDFLRMHGNTVRTNVGDSAQQQLVTESMRKPLGTLYGFITKWKLKQGMDDCLVVLDLLCELIGVCPDAGRLLDWETLQKWFSALLPLICANPLDDTAPAHLALLWNSLSSTCTLLAVNSLSLLRSQFVPQLLGLMADLAQPLASYSADNGAAFRMADRFSIENTQVDAFGRSLDVSTVAPCAAVAVACTRTLTSLVSTHVGFLCDSFAPVWELLALQVHRGPTPLRLASLECLSTLLRRLDLPHFAMDALLSSLRRLLFLRRRNERLACIDDTLGECLTLANAQFSAASLSGISLELAPLLVQATAETSSVKLKCALMALFRACQVANPRVVLLSAQLLPLLGTHECLEDILVECLEEAATGDGEASRSSSKRRRPTQFSPTRKQVVHGVLPKLMGLARNLSFSRRDSAKEVFRQVLVLRVVSRVALRVRQEAEVVAEHLGRSFALLKQRWGERPGDVAWSEPFRAALGFFVSAEVEVASAADMLPDVTQLLVCKKLSCTPALHQMTLRVMALLRDDTNADERRTALLLGVRGTNAATACLALELIPTFLERAGPEYAEQTVRMLLELLARHETLAPTVKRALVRCVRDVVASARDPSMLPPLEKYGDLSDIAAHVELEVETRCEALDALRVVLLGACVADVREVGERVLDTVLELMRAPNAALRMAAAQCAAPLARDMSPKGMAERLMSALSEAYVGEEEEAEEETRFRALGYVAAVVSNDWLMSCIIMLVDAFSHPKLSARAAAYDAMHALAARHQQSPLELLLMFRFQLCPFVVRKLVHEHPVFDEVCRFVGLSHLAFLEKTLPYWLPSFVAQGLDAELEAVVTAMGRELKPFMHENAVYPVLSIILEEPFCGDASPNLERIMCAQLGDLLDARSNDLLKELIVMLGDPDESVRRRVRDAFLKLAEASAGAGAKAHRGSAERLIADFLAHRFLAVIDELNAQLRDTKSPMAALRGFDQLLKMMAQGDPSHLHSLRPKILATLKLALRDQKLQSQACDVFFDFIRLLELPVLGLFLGQIVADLLPYVENVSAEVSAKVVAILHYLVVDNQQTMQEHFQHIHFLPDVEALRVINETVQQYAGVAAVSLNVMLEQVLQGMRHESMNVRQMAVKRLCSLIERYQARVDAMVHEGEHVDPRIVEQIKLLLVGGRDAPKEVRALYGQCLGLLGAVDPGRVNMVLRERFPEEETDMQLVSRLIKCYLLPALEDASCPRDQDRAALAIQDALRFMGCTENMPSYSEEHPPPSEEETAFLMWREQFEEAHRAVLRPFLSSHYLIRASSSVGASRRQGSVYASVESYRAWLGAWCLELIDKIKGRSRELFYAMRGVVNSHEQTARFLLPTLVLRSLDGAPQLRGELLEEVVAVLDAEGSTDMSQLCAATVFHLIDQLQHWVERVREESRGVSAKRGRVEQLEEPYCSVELLLREIPRLRLAEAAHRCNAHARALKSLEQHIRGELVQLEDEGARRELLGRHAPFMQRLWCGIGDGDALSGVASLRTSSSAAEEILDHEYTGNWSHALHWYDAALRSDPGNGALRAGMLRCLLNLGHFDTLLALVKGGEHVEAQASYGVQAAWRLTHWEELEGLLGATRECTFEVRLGKALLHLARQEMPALKATLCEARVEVMGPLAAASMDSYERAYPFLLQLHLLSDLERMASGGASESSHTEARFRALQPSFRTRSAVLHLRRVASRLRGVSTTRDWVELARAARKDGQYEAARSAVVQALGERPDAEGVRVELAKLLWAQGHAHEAILEVDAVLRQLRMGPGPEEGERVAKPQLLLARWLHETKQRGYDAIRAQYEEVTRVAPNWEAGHFFLANYQDEMVQMVEAEYKNEREESERARLEVLHYVPDILGSYRLALMRGHKYIHRALPRMLTLWFHYSAVIERIHVDAKGAKSQRGEKLKSHVRQINNKMKEAITSLPTYQWLTVLPQLISQVSHPAKRVVQFLKFLLTAVARSFPQQTLWHSMGLIMCKSASRKEAKKELKETLAAALRKQPEHEALWRESVDLCEQLNRLCRFQPAQGATTRKLRLSGTRSLAPLRRMRDLNLVLPSERALTASLAVDALTRPEWEPFPEELPRIQGVADEVEVIPSLMAPKKLTIRGSDGVDYPWLAKPKDDLRKDARVMDLNRLVNTMLARDLHSRTRDLRIYTYGVVPLSDETGLIEWVPNKVGYRRLAWACYVGSVSSSKIQQLWEKKKGMAPADRYHFIVNNYMPPRFYSWFLKNFPEPRAWLDARLAFTRTCAVMSMVGNVVGLGDRHGENILVDTQTGAVMHVDYSCLFHKGETFQCPETVPFRLTHNMVDAMGLSGYEGSFRRICEITMTILRRNRATLRAVLETLIHDPLVEWLKSKGALEDRARNIINKVDRALQGKVRVGGLDDRKSIIFSAAVPMSVEGQVEHLIQQATDPSNLGAMYRGWQSTL